MSVVGQRHIWESISVCTRGIGYRTMIICTCSSAVIAASALWFDDYCCYRLRWGLNNACHASNAMKFNDVCRFSDGDIMMLNFLPHHSPISAADGVHPHTIGQETADKIVMFVDGFSVLIWFRFRASAAIERILYFSVEFNYLFDRTNGHGDLDLILDVGSEWIANTSIIDVGYQRITHKERVRSEANRIRNKNKTHRKKAPPKSKRRQ